MSDPCPMTADRCRKQLTVCYAITPDPKYRAMAAASIYSLVLHNPGTRVRLREVDGGDHPYGIKPLALPDEPDGWVLFLDADTRVTGVLERLLHTEADFSARVGTAWTRGAIDAETWRRLFAVFHLPFSPGLNSGAFLCRAPLARRLRTNWATWMERIKASGVEDPLRQSTKPSWFMLDQFALTLAVADAGAEVRFWSRRQHSYGWCGEALGLIHHYGEARWKHPLHEETL